MMAFTRLIAIYLVFPGALAAQSFAGIASNSVNGQPLAGVHVKLFSLSILAGLTDAYGAMSASDGRFSIAAIPPGSYVLFTERTGFVQMMTPSGAIPLPTINLKSGERVTDYKLEMTPRAVINIRVVDDYGDPVNSVSVSVSPASPGSPVAASLNTSQSSFTSLLGETRISGGPGKFFIKATPATVGTQMPEIRTDGTSEASFGPTWYPSAPAEAAATPVEVAAGSRASIELRLIRQRSLTISGIVSGVPQDADAIVMLSTYDRAGGRRTNTRSSSAGHLGKFAFSKLPPAHYRVTALIYNNRTPMQSQSVDFTPDSPDALDVQLALATGAEIGGTLQITGEAPGAPTDKRTITLQPMGDAMTPATGTNESDGTFKMPDVFPGRYRVDVKPLPDNGYVKTVELNGAASSALELDLSRGAQGSRLKITLGRDAAQLSGTVTDKEGQPLGNTPSIVILTADREHIVPSQDGIVKEGGKYNFKNIRPGKYWLFAIDAFRSGLSNNEEDFKRLATAAEEIEIKPGEKIAKDLKILLKEDVDARNKK
ncbi:MAG: carboxypeptidase-like regulatory domain-containing protein [Candidatus Solibacter sp.]